MEDPEETENLYFGAKIIDPHSTNDISEKVTPVNVKLLLKARCTFKNQRFILDDEILSYVQLIAVVRSVNTKSVTYEATLEDDTGYITMKFDGSSVECNDPNIQNLELNTYYKIIGQLSLFFDNRFLSPKSVSKLNDFNELSHHGLSIILNTIQKKQRVDKRRLIKSELISFGIPEAKKIKAEDIQFVREKEIANITIPKINDDFLLEKIYKFISSSGNLLEGIHFNKIFEKFNINTESSTIKHILDSLVESGAIYTVDDDLHYSSFCS
ncbi:hypothetical protein AYI69_g293 [Smittium culicis]|uniref:Replication protein A C-terminal domain-containing protein n=1 Tax=Smittium culicis TaxID=133412 RepID=A0A1R1Y674_9FUNG|nr:hypothetical protein AYI69_g5399 [Smittium culicis]OMJ30162.1 hypothetical protein AYI69_g293 [Smittium culicis]